MFPFKGVDIYKKIKKIIFFFFTHRASFHKDVKPFKRILYNVYGTLFCCQSLQMVKQLVTILVFVKWLTYYISKPASSECLRSITGLVNFLKI